MKQVEWIPLVCDSLTVLSTLPSNLFRLILYVYSAHSASLEIIFCPARHFYHKIGAWPNSPLTVDIVRLRG